MFEKNIYDNTLRNRLSAVMVNAYAHFDVNVTNMHVLRFRNEHILLSASSTFKRSVQLENHCDRPIKFKQTSIRYIDLAPIYLWLVNIHFFNLWHLVKHISNIE